MQNINLSSHALTSESVREIVIRPLFYLYRPALIVLIALNTTDLSPEQVALKYKELWQVEHVFRDMKSILDTRPVFHQKDETIRGHVFCSFPALVFRKELQRRLEAAGHCFEWADSRQDLKSLQEIVVEDNGTTLAIRSECKGICGKVFQSVGVAVPPSIRNLE